MSSQRRIDASRRNGALSRGPRTAAGKSRSSQNATRHALLSKRVVLEKEDEEKFQLLFTEHLDKFQPGDGVELGFVEEMASSYWRFHRTLAIERGLFDEAVQKHPDSDGLPLLVQAWKDLDASGALQRLQRYQSSIHRTYRRAMSNLLLLREIEPNNTELPNEPSPNSEHQDTAPPDPSTEPAPAPGADPSAPLAGPVPPVAPDSPAAMPEQPAPGAAPSTVPPPQPQSITPPATRYLQETLPARPSSPAQTPAAQPIRKVGCNKALTVAHQSFRYASSRRSYTPHAAAGRFTTVRANSAGLLLRT